MKTNQDFYVEEGDPRTVTVPLFNPDGSIYLAPVGSTALWWASLSRFDHPAAAPIKRTPILTTVSGQTVVSIPLTNSDTQGRAGRWYHECQLMISGNPVTVFSGTMTVRKTLIA
jgi:hypothetical protein